MDNQSKQMKIVFTIAEREGKSFWTRIGVGFVNADGSINLKLDAIPTNGSMQIRDWEPLPERRDGGGGRSPAPRGRPDGQRREVVPAM